MSDSNLKFGWFAIYSQLTFEVRRKTLRPWRTIPLCGLVLFLFSSAAQSQTSNLQYFIRNCLSRFWFARCQCIKGIIFSTGVVTALSRLIVKIRNESNEFEGGWIIDKVNRRCAAIAGGWRVGLAPGSCVSGTGRSASVVVYRALRTGASIGLVGVMVFFSILLGNWRLQQATEAGLSSSLKLHCWDFFCCVWLGNRCFWSVWQYTGGLTSLIVCHIIWNSEVWASSMSVCLLALAPKLKVLLTEPTQLQWWSNQKILNQCSQIIFFIQQICTKTRENWEFTGFRTGVSLFWGATQ